MTPRLPGIGGIWLALILLSQPAVTQELTLPVLGRLELNIYSSLAFSEDSGFVFTDGIPGRQGMQNRLVRLRLDRPSVEELVDLHRYFGRLGGQMVVAVVDSNRSIRRQLLDASSLRPGPQPPWWGQVEGPILEHEEGRFFSARPGGLQGELVACRFDPAARSVRELGVQGSPGALSPDGLYLVIQTPERGGEALFWSISEKAVLGRIRSYAGVGHLRFLSSGVVLVAPEYPGERGWELVDLRGQTLATLRLGLAGLKTQYLWFSADLGRALACYDSGLNPQTVLVDASPLRRWLEGEGLLFQPRQGRLNDTRVRLRQYPHLEAKTIGYLEKGQVVEVLERSGAPVRLQGMEAYWYRVRTVDGAGGWSYGQFIDLMDGP